MTDLPTTKAELEAALAQAEAQGGQRVADAVRAHITSSTTTRHAVRQALAGAASVLHEEAVAATKAAEKAAKAKASKSAKRETRNAEIDAEIAKTTKAKRAAAKRKRS